MSAVTVSKLFSYPLKSAKGMFLKSAQVMPRGLQNDRLWMVYDPVTKDFISQRPIPGHEPRLATIHTSVLRDGDLMMDALGMYAEVVPNPNNAADPVQVDVTLFGNTLPALDAGDHAASWLSQYLNRNVRLVRFLDTHTRQVDQKYARNFDQTGFSDGYPILIASEESHAALNVNSGIDRFRPNIVLSGLKPFEEDSIASLGIGDVTLALQKPCKHCPMPGVNQKTGRFEKEGNPLPVLNQLRKGDDGEGLKGVFFAVNASPTSLGTINVGDEVRILSRHKLHPAVANTAAHYTA